MYPFFFFFLRKSGEQKITLNAVYANRVRATFASGFECIIVRFLQTRLSPDALASQIGFQSVFYSQCDTQQSTTTMQ